MLVDKFWVVKNPTEHSTMHDVCWESTPLDFAKYVLGTEVCGAASILEQENITFHTSERTARADAEGRMALRERLLKMLCRDEIRKMRETP